MEKTNRRHFIRDAAAAGGLAAAGSVLPAATLASPGPEQESPLLTVALLQLLPFENHQEKNLEKGLEFCRRAADMGADIALLPEIWSIGYTRFQGTAAKDIEAWKSQAIGRDSLFIREFRSLAKSTEMAIGVTYLEEWDPAPRNSISLIDRSGDIVLTYAKVHTSDFKTMECCCTPGEDFPVSTLDTARGEVEVGAMICFDREGPESARILMLNGAELLLTPNACVLDSRRIDQFKTRAFENAVAVAMANYPAPLQNGHSVAYGAEGELVVEAGEPEGIYLARFDLDRIRGHRAKTIWGNAFRRPHRYGMLAEPSVAPVFERKNGFGRPFRRKDR